VEPRPRDPHPRRHPWLTANQFLDKLDANLQRAMG